MELEYNKNEIIISKPKREKISLAERFANYKGSNLAKEYIWDEAKGKEIW